MSDLEKQLYAARGFSKHLAAQPSSDLNENLLHVLDVYQRELGRQISGDPVEQDWLGLLTLASMQASFLRDELVDRNPVLAAYNPEDDPTNIEEMTIRLLCDAIKLFDATVDGRVYLDIHPVAVEIAESIQRVLNAGQQR